MSKNKDECEILMFLVLVYTDDMTHLILVAPGDGFINAPNLLLYRKKANLFKDNKSRALEYAGKIN